MTKQEAIEQLKDLMEDAQLHMSGDDDDIFERDAEALRMGIEALTEQTKLCAS